MSVVGRGQKTEVEITPSHRKRTKVSVGDNRAYSRIIQGITLEPDSQVFIRIYLQPNMSSLGLHVKAEDPTAAHSENVGLASKASPGVFMALRTSSKASYVCPIYSKSWDAGLDWMGGVEPETGKSA